MSKTSRSELILQLLLELERQYMDCTDAAEYLAYSYNKLKSLVEIDNFFCVQYDLTTGAVNWLFTTEQNQSLSKLEITPESEDHSPLAWVIKHQKFLELRKNCTSENSLASHYWQQHKQVQHWLGIPLLTISGKCIGALAIECSNEENLYSEQDKSIFKVFCSHIAIAVEKYQKDSEMQSSLADKTRELEKELEERKKAERLQRALYQMAAKANECNELNSLFASVHSIIESLLYAKSFFIALYDEEKNEVSFPYLVDEYDSEIHQGIVLPLGKGLSSHVIKSRQPQLITPELVPILLKNGDICEVKGEQGFTCWLGVPMISSDILHGIIVVQSYDENIIYTQQDSDLLHYVANHVARAIELTINSQQRREAQLKLAKQHRILEQQHKEMHDTVATLQRTQQKLVQQEKMVSLGGLVAGIAHEINTPLGICVTGVSHLMEELRFTKNAWDDQTLTDEMLSDFLEEVDSAGKILTSNTQRAADLVSSFKQVAVDQSSDNVRRIELHQYIQEVLLSLKPRLKRVNHQIRVECPENFYITANAGAISQILSNLIMNSITHAFDGIEVGHIVINVSEKNNFVILRYADDGNGLDEAAMSLLFEPFYTTKRGEGGSGLGAHLVYNLVTTSLSGRIQAKSEIGKGLAYLIKFPMQQA